jgi:hypothetical protein
MQSTSVMQLLLQAVAPHTYWSQLFTTGGAQLPAPSQKAALVCVPAVQDGSPHMVVAGALAQVWSAAQVPVLPHLPLAAQDPCGSATPVPTKVQVPALPVTLHDWQSGQSLSFVSQQTPSTQRPAAHWLSALQPAPMPPALAQCPVLSQNAPDAQSSAPLQVVLHPVAVQV